MKVVEIAFVGYPVTDMNRAREFYEGTLGLTQSRTLGNQDVQWVEYDIGTGTLALVSASLEWQPSPQGAAAALEVDDFDEAMERIRRDGVKIIFGPFEGNRCQTVVVLDPDGNSIAIHKLKPGMEQSL